MERQGVLGVSHGPHWDCSRLEQAMSPLRGGWEELPTEAHLDREKLRATFISLFALETRRLNIQSGI